VMLFVIGFEISFSKQNSVQVLSTCIIRLIIMGTMSIFVIRLLTSLIEMDNYLITAVRLLFFLPAPYILPIFTQNEENRTFTSTVLSVNLLFSMVAFAIIAFQNAI